MRKRRPRWWPPITSRRARARLAKRMAEIGAVAGAGPAPAFRNRLRDELMLAARAAETVSAPAPHPEPPARRRHRQHVVILRLVVLGTAIVVTVTALVTYRSVPGDPLYPLKRVAESTLLELSADEVARAEGKLRAAQERAAEVAALLGIPDRVNLVDQTLDDMEESTRSAVCTLKRVDAEHPETRTDLRRFAENQHRRMTSMLPRMDERTQRQVSGYLSYIESLAEPDGVVKLSGATP